MSDTAVRSLVRSIISEARGWWEESDDRSADDFEVGQIIKITGTLISSGMPEVIFMKIDQCISDRSWAGIDTYSYVEYTLLRCPSYSPPGPYNLVSHQVLLMRDADVEVS